MKALLICPSGRPAVPHLAESGPLATAPILGASIVSHWIEHLAALGASQIRVIAAQGADQVRAAVGDGARWGVHANVTESSFEPSREEAARRFRPEGETGWLPPPDDVITLSHLPGCPGLPLFESYASWFAALIAWMPLALTPARVRMVEARPGIWVGSRARVSPMAKLFAPCWIGDQVLVGARAVIGPGAILEDRTVVEGSAVVTESWVGPDTCVGPMTRVANSLAWGSTLVDWRNDSALLVPDPFLLCSLARPQPPAAAGRLGHANGAQVRPDLNLNLITALHARIDSGPGTRAARLSNG